MAETLGDTTCHLCGEAAEVKENRSGKAYVSCEWCSTQIQTRTKHGDRHIRQLIEHPHQPEPKEGAPDGNPQPAETETETETEHAEPGNDRDTGKRPAPGRRGRRLFRSV